MANDNLSTLCDYEQDRRTDPPYLRYAMSQILWYNVQRPASFMCTASLLLLPTLHSHSEKQHHFHVWKLHQCSHLLSHMRYLYILTSNGLRFCLQTVMYQTIVLYGHVGSKIYFFCGEGQIRGFRENHGTGCVNLVTLPSFVSLQCLATAFSPSFQIIVWQGIRFAFLSLKLWSGTFGAALSEWIPVHSKWLGMKEGWCGQKYGQNGRLTSVAAISLRLSRIWHSFWSALPNALSTSCLCAGFVSQISSKRWYA